MTQQSNHFLNFQIKINELKALSKVSLNREDLDGDRNEMVVL
jgi:hypothetical protein